MTIATAVPKTDAEVFELYYSHVKRLVSRMHIKNVEDVSMDLMEKFIAKGILEQYDPEHDSGANFKTFFSNFVTSYLMHFVDKERKAQIRIPFSCDVIVGDSEGEGGTLGIDLLTHVEADTTTVEADELVSNVRKAIADKPRLALFFEFVLLQVEEDGKMNVAELADLFEVSRVAIYDWRHKLQEVFKQCQ